MMAEDPKKAEQYVDKLDQEDKDQIMQNFNTFKNYLGDQVKKGESIGLGEKGLAKATKRVAEHLAKHEEPRNREEKVLNELWQNAEKDEKDAIAKALVRMVDKTNKDENEA